MLKNISKLGKTLSKIEQRNINGGSLLPPIGPIGDAEGCTTSSLSRCDINRVNSCGLSEVCLPDIRQCVCV